MLFLNMTPNTIWLLKRSVPKENPNLAPFYFRLNFSFTECLRLPVNVAILADPQGGGSGPEASQSLWENHPVGQGPAVLCCQAAPAWGTTANGQIPSWSAHIPHTRCRAPEGVRATQGPGFAFEVGHVDGRALGILHREVVHALGGGDGQHRIARHGALPEEAMDSPLQGSLISGGGGAET